MGADISGRAALLFRPSVPKPQPFCAFGSFLSLTFGVLTVGVVCDGNVWAVMFGDGFIPFIIADTAGDEVGGGKVGCGAAFIGAVPFFLSIS